MKRILSLLLALALVFALVGCQASNWPPETTQAPEASAATTQTTTAPEETPGPTTQPETEPTALPTEKPEPKPTEPKPTQPKPTQPAQTDPPPETQPPVVPPDTQPPIMPPETEPTAAPTQPSTQKSYTRKDEVALYIREHGCLPDNFITKSEARRLGWKSGSLEKYAPGKCIGGDRFYNREGLLPDGHTYYECDIDTLGKSSRGAKRIVFSTDGLIYYTADHYKTFTLLYGDP